MLNGFFPPEECAVCKKCKIKHGRAVEATEDNIKRRTRISCWLTKATDTHSEYVTGIAFPRQQLLCKLTRWLRYTYVSYLIPLAIATKTNYNTNFHRRRLIILDFIKILLLQVLHIFLSSTTRHCLRIQGYVMTAAVLCFIRG